MLLSTCGIFHCNASWVFAACRIPQHNILNLYVELAMFFQAIMLQAVGAASTFCVIVAVDTLAGISDLRGQLSLLGYMASVSLCHRFVSASQYLRDHVILATLASHLSFDMSILLSFCS